MFNGGALNLRGRVIVSTEIVYAAVPLRNMKQADHHCLAMVGWRHPISLRTCEVVTGK